MAEPDFSWEDLQDLFGGEKATGKKIDLMHEQTEKEIKRTRNKLAKEFGYSPTYFSRLFQENFNCGLCQYINNLRYERTLSQIDTSSGNKSDLILSNGFNNVQSYYRIDRKRRTQYTRLKEFHNSNT